MSNKYPLKIFIVLLFVGLLVQCGSARTEWETLGFEGKHLDSIAVSPQWPNDPTIVVGWGYWGGEVSYTPTIYIRRSDSDGNPIWDERILPGQSAAQVFEAIALSPGYSVDHTIFVVVNNPNGLYISRNSGSTWTERLISEAGGWDIDFSPNFVNDRTVFLTGWWPYISTDGGESFKQLNMPLSEGDSGSPLRWGSLSAADIGENGVIFLGTIYGLFKSNDNGVTWIKMESELPHFDGTTNSAIWNIVMSPTYSSDQTVFISVQQSATEAGGVYRSTDGGDTWQKVTPFSSFYANHHAMEISDNYQQDGTVIVACEAGYEGYGILISRDYGTSWSWIDRTGFSDYPYRIALSPQFETDNTIFGLDREYGGLLKVVETQEFPPVTENDQYTVDEDAVLTVAAPGVLGNDVDQNGDPISAEVITGPCCGVLVLNNDGAFTYIPRQDYDAADYFTYSVSDGTGYTSQARVDLTVTPLNDPPLITSINDPSTNPAITGSTVSMSAFFTDPDLGDTRTATWAWGDGITGAGQIDEYSKTVTGSHLYSVSGVYPVTLTLSDKAGESSISQYQYIVVYNPATGYVSGHGRIYSPTGALKSDLLLAGDASFGFVSKYQRGATTPDGSTRFRFQVADFEFKSTSYDWLVIAGAKAQYKGLGEVNGQGPYKFILSAVDADQNPADSFNTDRFRLKIWTEDASKSEQIVYDNALGMEVDSSSLTEIEKGEIDIRKDTI